MKSLPARSWWLVPCGIMAAGSWIINILAVLLKAVWNHNRCSSRCRGNHPCGKPLITWIGSLPNLHLHCPPCEVPIKISFLDCDHCINMECADVTAKMGPGGNDLEELDCVNGELLDIRCVKLIDLVRDCDHVVKGIPCSEKKEIVKTPCDEIVEEPRSCGLHVSSVTCKETAHFDAGMCKTPVTQILECGHERKTMCYRVKEINLKDVKCLVMVAKRLECGHAITAPCAEIDHVPCQDSLRLERPDCEHSVEYPCSGEVPDDLGPCTVRCKAVVECGHECSLLCSHSGGHKCDVKCILTCGFGHPCQADHPCGEKCPPCTEIVRVSRSICFHHQEMECWKQQIPGDIGKCHEKCPRTLLCGHKCVFDCSEHRIEKINNYNSLYTTHCPQERCEREEHGVFLPCSHTCHEPCRDHEIREGRLICSPCREGYSIRYCEKKHVQKILCNDARTVTVCAFKLKKTKILKCGHGLVTVLKCDARLIPVGNELPQRVPSKKRKDEEAEDNHVCKSKCGAKLACGHSCQQMCASCVKNWAHPRCLQDCEKTLVSGHECPEEVLRIRSEVYRLHKETVAFHRNLYEQFGFFDEYLGKLKMAKKAVSHQELAVILIFTRIYNAFIKMAKFLEDYGEIGNIEIDQFMTAGVRFLESVMSLSVPLHLQEEADIQNEMERVLDRLVFCRLTLVTQPKTMILDGGTGELMRTDKFLAEAREILYSSERYLKSDRMFVKRMLKSLSETLKIQDELAELRDEIYRTMGMQVIEEVKDEVQFAVVTNTDEDEEEDISECDDDDDEDEQDEEEDDDDQDEEEGEDHQAEEENDDEDDGEDEDEDDGEDDYEDDGEVGDADDGQVDGDDEVEEE